jgi:DNA-binding CsgD family transcriptional regulator
MTFDPALLSAVLVPVADRFASNSRLAPSERAEVLRIAQGFACKDSAAAANVSPETIRARRKRIYRKLDLAGSSELISALLAFSLRMLSSSADRVETRSASPSSTGIGAEVAGA